MQIQPPLDFAGTLDVLADWAGREVLVIAHSQAPGQPLSHTQVTARGALGDVEMVDNQIDQTVQSVAAYKVGDGPMNAIYLSTGDFVHTMRLGDGHINIKFAHDFHIEVQLV